LSNTLRAIRRLRRIIGRFKSAFAGYVGNVPKARLAGQYPQRRQQSVRKPCDGLARLRVSPDLGAATARRWGFAFKAPTFNDLYLIDPFFIPNPDLRPERSRSKETGLNYQMGANRFSANVFRESHHRSRRLRLRSRHVCGNREESEPREDQGTELGYQVSSAGCRASAQLTLQDPVDEETGKLLPRRAREYGSVAASYAAGRGGSAPGDRKRSALRFRDEDPAKKMHGYALVNLTASYTAAGVAPTGEMEQRLQPGIRARAEFQYSG